MSCKYNFYPLDVLAGCGGTYLLFRFSKFLTKSSISLLLGRIGTSSLLILCIHTIELNSGIRDMSNNTYIQILIMLLGSLPLAYVLNKVYCIKLLFYGK